jgi:hypothetical protein
MHGNKINVLSKILTIKVQLQISEKCSSGQCDPFYNLLTLGICILHIFCILIVSSKHDSNTLSTREKTVVGSNFERGKGIYLKKNGLLEIKTLEFEIL